MAAAADKFAWQHFSSGSSSTGQAGQRHAVLQARLQPHRLHNSRYNAICAHRSNSPLTPAQTMHRSRSKRRMY